MIVIGVDVHKQSLTAVAVDEAGRMLDERTVVGAGDALVTWANFHKNTALSRGAGWMDGSHFTSYDQPGPVGSGPGLASIGDRGSRIPVTGYTRRGVVSLGRD